VYHTDGLGSVRAISDGTTPTPLVVQTYATDEFGIPDAAGTQGSLSQAMQYTGEPRDAESGFVYLRARTYDPQVGRFLQRDRWPGILETPSVLNRFTYVENNPMNYTDPSGLKSAALLPGPCAWGGFWRWLCPNTTNPFAEGKAQKQTQPSRMTLTLQFGVGWDPDNPAVGVNDNASGAGVTGLQVMDAIPTLYALGEAGGRVTQAALATLAAAQFQIANELGRIIAGGGYLGAYKGLINIPLADGWRFELDANYGYNLRQW
jgi:RHS repeat-associated protein